MKTTELTKLRDEIFKLTGVAVAEFQFLEHVLTACLAFVWPEKSQQMLAEIASDNPIRRGETIGRMLSVLRKTIKAPSISINGYLIFSKIETPSSTARFANSHAQETRLPRRNSKISNDTY